MAGSRGECADTSSVTLLGSSSYIEEESGSSEPVSFRKVTCPVPRQHSHRILWLKASHFSGVPCNSDSQLKVTSSCCPPN